MSAQEKKQQTWDVIIHSVEEDFNRIAAIDNVVSFERESKYVLQILQGNEYLQKANLQSLLNAITNVASVGLTLNPAMKLAYLVPRDGKAYLDISYIGLMKIAMDTGSVLAAKAELVYANDAFEYNGPFEKPVHKFNPFKRGERGEIVGVYVIAKLASGIDQIDVLDMEEIAKIRAKSKAKTGPWTEWFEEMMKKAAIKRAAKNWPRTPRLSQAEHILNEHEGNEGPVSQGRVSGTAAAEAAQEQERQGAGDLDEVSKMLDEESKKGVDAYAAAWGSITKKQRQALKTQHVDWKAAALQADAQDVPFRDVPEPPLDDIPPMTGEEYVPE